MKIRRKFSFSWFIWFCLCSGAILLIVGLYELRWLRLQSELTLIKSAAPDDTYHCDRPVYAIYGHDVSTRSIINLKKKWTHDNLSQFISFVFLIRLNLDT